MKIRLLAALALLVPAGAAAQSSQAESLHAFLRSSFAEIRESSPEASYTAAFADLNGDGRNEALMWSTASFFCGSGGCALYIYTPDGASWRQVSELTIATVPVRLLATRTRGWRDLALFVRDGGMGLPRQVRMRFYGNDYSLSPRLRGRTGGRLLITDETPSRPLFR